MLDGQTSAGLDPDVVGSCRFVHVCPPEVFDTEHLIQTDMTDSKKKFTQQYASEKISSEQLEIHHLSALELYAAGRTHLRGNFRDTFDFLALLQRIASFCRIQ